MKKEIPSLPGHYVDTDGNVYFQERLLPRLNNGFGYFKFNVVTIRKQKYIHRVMAETFLDNPNNFKYVDHIDRNKANNKIENLRWVSASENSKNNADEKRYKNQVGKRPCVRASSNIKDSIIQDYKNGSKVMELSRKYGIPRQSVSRFVKGVVVCQESYTTYMNTSLH